MIAAFGVGKNMVRAIKYWGLATKVLDPKLWHHRLSGWICRESQALAAV